MRARLRRDVIAHDERARAVERKPTRFDEREDDHDPAEGPKTHAKAPDQFSNFRFTGADAGGAGGFHEDCRSVVGTVVGTTSKAKSAT